MPESDVCERKCWMLKPQACACNEVLRNSCFCAVSLVQMSSLSLCSLTKVMWVGCYADDYHHDLDFGPQAFEKCFKF